MLCYSWKAVTVSILRQADKKYLMKYMNSLSFLTVSCFHKVIVFTLQGLQKVLLKKIYWISDH